MISGSSQVLIVGVSPACLVLAVSLAKAGIEVLVIHDGNNSRIAESEVNIDAYDRLFLNHFGFEAKESDDLRINLKHLENQALKLLANSACRILWETQITNIEVLSGRFNSILESGNKVTAHQTSLIVSEKDLELANSFIASLKNTIILSWKIQGYFNGLLSPKVYNHHQEEKEIIKNYYAEDDFSKSIFHKLYDKFLKVKKGELNFRESKINLHLSQFRGVNAGDLLPDYNLYDEKQKTETSLYEWCKLGRFSLIMFGDLPAFNLNKYANWLKVNYKLDVYYLPFTEKNAKVFELFEIPNGEKKTVIVRPDRFIGLINDRVELEIIENYLNNILFIYPNAKAFSPKELNAG